MNIHQQQSSIYDHRPEGLKLIYMGVSTSALHGYVQFGFLCLIHSSMVPFFTCQTTMTALF